MDAEAADENGIDAEMKAAAAEAADGTFPSAGPQTAHAKASFSATEIIGGGDLNESEERRRALYRLFQSGDARYDGHIYVGVASTGIYCRIVCSAKMPKFENCSFFRTPAQAEAAGYRPCLTCRPESAPGMSSADANASLARRAASMLRECCAEADSTESVAARLGYTGRHLRRAFAAEYGVTPTQYVTTCRLLLAKSLLTDSRLPVAQVAAASGFCSVRRFNDAFKKHYRLTPSDVRKKRGKTGAQEGSFSIRLSYRPPYGFEDLTGFLAMRAIAGVERTENGAYERTARLTVGGTETLGWLRVQNEPAKNRLIVTLSDSLVPHVPLVVGRIRRMFDIDCDPAAVAGALKPLEAQVPGIIREGVRLPGCFDPFETSCRAILGQQISVKAASRLAERIAEAFGTEVSTGIEGLNRAWPTPAEVLALPSIEDAFGELGVIKTRSRTIAEIARLLESGELDLNPGADPEAAMERLLAVKGIGPWTANYIAMRVLGYTDAFLETDVGVAHGLPDLSPKERIAAVEPCRPWRSYAVLSLWNSLG